MTNLMPKILIIDDDDIVLMVERKLLQRCGVTNEIISFKKGQKALDFLLNEDPNQEFLILLDINMPTMNGWQFLSKLQELNVPNVIHVIMVTSSIDGYDKEVAEKYNCIISFIEKPITSDTCENIKQIPLLKEYF